MEGSTNLPEPSEADTHVAHLANPTLPTHVPIHDHPPYPEMILGAIAALKERDGSSKRAISKYIEKAYPNLPPAHSSLLTHHLKLLKNKGQVIIFKRSYKLPGYIAASPNLNTNEAHTSVLASSDTSSVGPKRERGRPPRPKASATDIGLSNINKANTPAITSSNGCKRGRGRPPKPKATVVLQPNGENGSDAMLSSLGLTNGHGNVVNRTRRRPKRPKFVETGSDGQTIARKGPGRSPKPKTLPVGMVSLKQRRRPGRPPKAGSSAASGNMGRPKTFILAQAKTIGRPLGGPPKKAQLVPFAGDSDGAVGVPKPKKPRKLTGRPLGRPRKNASRAAVESTDSHYVVAYQVLNTKYEQIQLKVQQAVSLIKPHLNSQTSDSILRALEEMEGLARVDATAPINCQVK